MHSDLDRADLDRGGALKQLLRGLPEETQPPYDFREFERRARERMLPPGTGGRGQSLAIAAALAVMSIMLLMVRFGTPPAPRIAADEVAAQGSAAPATNAAPEAAEHWLAGFPDDPALVRVGSRAAVTGLEDRIAQLDDLLSAVRTGRAQPARLAALQQERTRLVGALIQVRYAETLANAAQ
jgi:hypothetical protein